MTIPISKYYPGQRIYLLGKPFIVVGVRRTLESARRLATREQALWSILGSLYVVMRPADSVTTNDFSITPASKSVADHPAMREAMA
jgi:hypothetical protein